MAKKLRVLDLINCEMILDQAALRGTLPVNYVVDRNRGRLRRALAPLRARIKTEEPLKWHFAPAEKVTEEQAKAAKAAYAEWIALDVEFEAYKLDPAKLCDDLKALPEGRETLDDKGLAELRANFYAALNILGILPKEGDE